MTEEQHTPSQGPGHVRILPLSLNFRQPPSEDDDCSWTEYLTARYNILAELLNTDSVLDHSNYRTLDVLAEFEQAQKDLLNFSEKLVAHVMLPFTSIADELDDGGVALHRMQATRHPLVAWLQLLRALYEADAWMKEVEPELKSKEVPGKVLRLFDDVLGKMPMRRRE